jgi:hypothetical protein
LMTNSDHANFAIAGIPAFRMVAGYDDPSALVRLVLTAADTRDKVARPELAAAARLAACLTAAACQVDGPTASSWRAGGDGTLMDSASWRDFRGRAFSSRTCKAYAVAIPGRLGHPTYRLRTAFRLQATNGRFAPLPAVPVRGLLLINDLSAVITASDPSERRTKLFGNDCGRKRCKVVGFCNSAGATQKRRY